MKKSIEKLLNDYLVAGSSHKQYWLSWEKACSDRLKQALDYKSIK